MITIKGKKKCAKNKDTANKNAKEDYDKDSTKVDKVRKHRHSKETDANESNDEEVIKIKGKKQKFLMK